MPKVKANNINLYYEVHGKGEPLFFISGFNSDHTLWNNIVDHYAKNYQVILIDNRGSGASDFPDIPYSIKMMADDVVDLCKTLGINQAHFVGSSMGGAIVQTIAYKYSNLVRKTVLYNTFTQIDIKFALFAQGRLELFKANISQESMTKLSLGWVLTSECLSQEGMIDSIIGTSLTNPPPTTFIGYKNQLNALLTFNSTSWIQKIISPCLVIGSDKDLIVSEEHMRQMANQIPNASYHCFNNMGHLVHLEKPEAFNEIIDKFLLS